MQTGLIGVPGSGRCAPSLVVWRSVGSYDGAWRRSSRCNGRHARSRLKPASVACVSKGIRERPPQQGTAYRGFVDPSGGSADSFTLAIAHLDNTRNVVVVDVLRERKPPFSPEHVVGEFATQELWRLPDQR